jgi:hypothetical protein
MACFCLQTCKFIFSYIHTCTHTYLRTHIHTKNTRTHAHTHTQHTHIQTYKHTHTDTETHTHTRVHAYIHMHKRIIDFFSFPALTLMMTKQGLCNIGSIPTLMWLIIREDFIASIHFHIVIICLLNNRKEKLIVKSIVAKLLTLHSEKLLYLEFHQITTTLKTVSSKICVSQ